MSKVITNIRHTFFEWPSAVAISFWFGFFFTIGYRIQAIRGTVFFSSFPANTRIILGFFLLSFTVAAFIKPDIGGLGITYVICGAQILDSILTHQYARIVVWFLIASFATWGVIQRTYLYQFTYHRKEENE